MHCLVWKVVGGEVGPEGPVWAVPCAAAGGGRITGDSVEQAAPLRIHVSFQLPVRYVPPICIALASGRTR